MLNLSPSPGRLPRTDFDPAQLERGSSPGADAWRRLRRNRLAVAGGCFLALLAFAAFVLPLFLRVSSTEQNLALGAVGPSAAHWFGTDTLGRDLFVRILHGCRLSLGVGFAATLVSLTIGVIYGAVAGYAGGKADLVLMRIVDILYALPFTIFVILLTVFFGRDLLMLFVAIGAVEWLTMARIVRSQVLSIKRMEYIEAARALGYGTPRILFRHMLPNAVGPIIVYTTLTIPAVMLLEAFLSFLGLGVQAPMSSLGTLINEGRERMEESWWMLVFPGTIFSLTLFSLNFLGDGLRDAFDVRAAKD